MASVDMWTHASTRWTTLAIISFTAAGGLLYLFKSRNSAEGVSTSAHLHRSNAVRRRRQNTADDNTGASLDLDTLRTLDGTNLPATADDAATEVSLDDDNDDDVDTVEDVQAEQGQKLRELVFAISKNRAKSEGVVHRGITCDSCNRVPILGVRYRCANCQDFDLCEDCESQDAHIRTHVFYKIKVPAPWAGKQPLEVWYPGRPDELPRELNNTLKSRLSDTLGCSHNQLDGFYLQFSCLANTSWSIDPLKLNYAIDRTAFDQCFIPHPLSKQAARPNLVHDRLFDFYDVDRNGLIDFEEFVKATLIMHSRKPVKDKRARVFRALDLDGDGFIDRKDCLRFFRAYYNLNKEIILDRFAMERAGEDPIQVASHQTPADHVSSGRPLAPYFSEGYNDFGVNLRATEGKHVDDFGDLIPVNPGVLGHSDSSTINREQIIRHTWTSPYEELDVDITRVLCGQQSLFGLNDRIVVLEGRYDNVLLQNDSQLLIRWAINKGPVPNRTLFLKADPADVDLAVCKDLPLEKRILNSDFVQEISWRTSNHFIRLIVAAKEERAVLKWATRQAHEQFQRLEDDIPHSDARIGTNQNITNQRYAVGQSRISVIDDSSNPVTSFDAVHTIYEITQEALNDMLDPLFKGEEATAIMLQKTAKLRNKYRNSIIVYITAASKGQMRTESQMQVMQTVLMSLRQNDMSGWFELETDLVLNRSIIPIQYDPTMPQFRPDAADMMNTGEELRPPSNRVWAFFYKLVDAELHDERTRREKGGYARLSFDDFARVLREDAEGGTQLLNWVDSWMKIVGF